MTVTNKNDLIKLAKQLGKKIIKIKGDIEFDKIPENKLLLLDVFKIIKPNNLVTGLHDRIEAEYQMIDDN